MAEAIIPPWVRPESPETIRMIDDATIAFPPAFGRGMTQRGIWADPRWGLRRRYRGLRSDEQAAILNALNNTRGQLNILRVTPHKPIRGSFATSELLTNNTFASGTTGWTATGGVMTVSDRTARLTMSAFSFPNLSQSISLVQYAPYVLRSFISDGIGTAGLTIGPGIGDGTAVVTPNYSTTRGMRVVATVARSASADLMYAAVLAESTNISVGVYYSVSYTSLARCALADNGVNLALWSNDHTKATWTVSGTTVTYGSVAYDGTSTASQLVETVANSQHYIIPTTLPLVLPAASIYRQACAYFKRGSGTRNVVLLADDSSGNGGAVVVNLGTGATSIINIGTGTNTRAITIDMTGGWFYVSVVSQLTAASTSARVIYYLTNTTTTAATYVGDGTSSILATRVTINGSALPMRTAFTNATAALGSQPVVGAMYTKGWPASTNGLLLAGDWFEINGELKQLTAPVNSDAAGLAYMQFGPCLGSSPADNDPVIVQEPFGRFIYPQGTREFENLFGIYGDCEMNLEEVYS
jgi:hypothetical protein